MDNVALTIGIISGGAIALIGFLLGVYAESMVQQKKAQGPAPKVPVPQEPKKEKPKESEPEKPTTELGGVERPTAEDIKKKENPRLQEEEDAWEDIKEIMNDSAAAVFRHPNTNLAF